MLLAIDIGNSNIVLGIHHQQQWVQHWRIQTITNRTPDEYDIIFQQLFQHAGIAFNEIRQAILSSVVPNLTHTLATLLQKRLHFSPIVLNHQTDHGLTLATNPPESTGTDLIANAVAASEQANGDCLIVDFGTATTIMAVTASKTLLGGVIAAGLKTTSQALVNATSQLPNIELTPPQQIIGNNTIAAMQSGLVVGHLCLIEGLIKKMKAELTNATVFATGGLATTLCQNVTCIDQIDPLLTLNGLRIICERVTRQTRP